MKLAKYSRQLIPWVNVKSTSTCVQRLITVWLMIYLSQCKTKILMWTWHAIHFFHRQFRINNPLKHYNIYVFFKGCFFFFCYRLLFLLKLFLNWITQRMPPRNNQSLFYTVDTVKASSFVFYFLLKRFPYMKCKSHQFLSRVRSTIVTFQF